MSDPRSLPLLIEIGCEEIPARFLAQTQKDFEERLRFALAETGLRWEPTLETYSTPRRLVAHVPSIRERPADLVERVIGPAAKVAFDSQGKPTRAAEAFAAKNGVTVRDLFQVETPKGIYVALDRHTPGRPAIQVLGEILPGIITGLSVPKSMYWEPTKTRWVRPIRWILALLGQGESAQVVPFEIAGVHSGNRTHGHRKFEIGNANSEFPVSSFLDYAAKLRQAEVEFDPAERRAIVQAQLKVSLESSAFRVVPDNDLEAWSVNSTEWPRALAGSFEERFLKLPREILITVMRGHQHYFAVEDSEGKLRARFVTVLNRELGSPIAAPTPNSELRTPNPAVVIRHGHERVLTARFTDAEFFWNADQKVTLAERFREGWLDHVTYQAKLGSYGDKIRRMESICQQVCFAVRPSGRLMQRETADAIRAIQLCKCDLTTAMVQEFTELQGVVGGLYAAAQGERQEVAEAIYDHYRPQGMEDACPRSLAGAVASVADKLDSIVAGFAAGLEPTGSSDPFGLRRAGNGVVKIAVESLIGLDLLQALSAFPFDALGITDREGLEKRVQDFFAERVEYYLKEVKGLRYDTARAAVRSVLGWTKPADTLARGVALERFVAEPDFVALSQAAKRTRNILVKSEKIDYSAGLENVRAELFREPEEQNLLNAFLSVWGAITDLEQKREYQEAFRLLAGIRPAVDAFFDRVLVMAEDPQVRNNRLTLLNSLHNFAFWRLADLSQIESNISNVGAPTSKVVTSDQ